MLSVAFFHWGCMFVGLSRVWEQVYLEGGRARINHFVLPLVGLHKPVFFFQLVFFFFFPSSSCSFLLWFLVLWSEMPITFMFFQSSHHSYSSWLKTVISPEHSYLVPIGIFLSVDHQCICLSFSIVSIGTRGFVIVAKIIPSESTQLSDKELQKCYTNLVFFSWHVMLPIFFFWKMWLCDSHSICCLICNGELCWSHVMVMQIASIVICRWREEK